MTTTTPGRSDRERDPAVVRLGAWCDLVDEQDIRRRAAATAPFVSPRTSSEDAVPALAPVDVDREIADVRRQASFVVHEFTDLSDGSRVTLHRERGFTVSTGRADPWPLLTREHLEDDVPTTVLPDEDDRADEHPYDWLAGLCAAHGVSATPDDLRAVPYTVVLSRRVLDRLSAPHPGPRSSDVP